MADPIESGPPYHTPSQPDEVEAIAQVLLDRFINRSNLRGGSPYPAGTKLSSLPPSYKDDFKADAAAILAMQAERQGDNTIQRDKIYRAAERSNTRFGQWIPERWVNIFVEEMSK